MVVVEQAKQIILENVQTLSPIRLPLEQSFGKRLAEDIYAPIDLPAFAQAGMDGYAFRFEEGRTTYSIIGEVAAGSDLHYDLKLGEAVRIFTGAPVPAGADTVVMQEKTERHSDSLLMKDEKLAQGQNYRPAGSDIKQHELAIKAGHLLTPAAIGFLAALGITEVSVVPTPRVAILVTGDELQSLGNPLSYGQIYEANSYSLRAALQSIGINSVFIHTVDDDQHQLERYIQESLHLADMVLITGGVSVGDYDYTLHACQQKGVHIHFHGVKQKPGKPLLFGMKAHKPVFGLPGNPSSVLTCFYQYVFPALGKMMDKHLALETTTAIMQDNYQKPAGITHFLRATLNDGMVSIRKGQESYKLVSFAHADAFILLPEETISVQAGDEVIVQKIPS